MTTRRTAIAALAITTGLALGATAIAPAATAAPADRLPPELVGALDQSFELFAELEGGIYAITGTGLLMRIDGDTPVSLGPSFSSVYGFTGFEGALHVSALSGDNTFDVLRIELDGTTTTTLDDGAATFLGGITSIGQAGDVLYAGSSTVDGALRFSTVDGLTWSGAGVPAGSPTLIQSIIGVGNELYVDGFISGVRGVYRWVAPDWQLVPGIAGGISTLAAGIDRLLVGTSEGLYSVVGGTSTELDGTVVNPRSMAEFDGEVWWVDDDLELRSIDAEGVRTVHDPVPSGTVTGRLYATSTALYFTVRDDEEPIDSTYRIDLEPSDNSDGTGDGGEALPPTGPDGTIGPLGAAMMGLLLAGSALVLARMRLGRGATE